MNTKKQEIIISVVKDFSPYPAARYRSDGNNSGEEFYEDILKPKLEKYIKDETKKIVIDLDGTYSGYASSFISEVFIRLTKDLKDKELIKKRINFKSDDDPLLIDYILKTIEETNFD